MPRTLSATRPCHWLRPLRAPARRSLLARRLLPTLLPLLLAGPAAGQPPPVADTLAQRLQACTPCHGRDGRATAQGYFPRLAGKPAGYLFNQLRHFRDGQRHHGAMTGLVQHLGDDYLREMAVHFAEQNPPHAPPPQQPLPAVTAARGRQLALQGDPSLQLPACATCHGAALGGQQPATPGLLGLPRDYLTAQLGAWRHGLRQASAPDCMAEVARRLDPGDLEAVTRWLALQPAGAPAEPPPTRALPLRCGSAAAAR